MKYIAPSILSADFARLYEEIKETEKQGIRYLHVDVMDGLFVPSISFGMPVIRSIRKCTDMFFDTHLMIQDPERYIKDFADAGADGITIHAEAAKDIRGTVDKIHALGKKAGIAVDPETDPHILKSYADIADLFLVMTVHPGFGGQKMIRECLDKIDYLNELRRSSGRDFLIEADGGIKVSNIREVSDRGCDIMVAGSAVYGGSIEENIRNLSEVIS
ncbi:MAG: ribulose-phosphate 3-epimerase [Lachnospiraceae bacterium]|jgi:ribulose-phosphate 3-epimerase|nr:ribulose-phosphate 3-epimerase [Lachnospiraceae bacterium]MEE3460494.1 ribulose-phosphate 3-epimerase [Lachnospiraceae bacterium]